jgi:hypothetical protein
MKEAADPGSGRPKRATMSTTATAAEKEEYAANQRLNWRTENAKLNQEGDIVLKNLVADPLIGFYRRKAA